MTFLIIKTGEYETFDLEERLPIVSYGDILRSTVLAHTLENIHWFTSPAGERLLLGQNLVKEINPTQYDVVLNLENSEQITKNLKSNTIGFIGKNKIRLMSGEELTLSEFHSTFDHLNWAEKLFKIVGKDWKGERPVLLVASTEKKADIGLNWRVGPKWPTKDWGRDNWQSVYEILSSNLRVTWQKGFNDLTTYIEWISSVKVLLTHDSLGLHIAQALQIPVVALFGPTSSKEIPLYEEDIFLDFHKDPHLTSFCISEILNQVLLRSENESTVRWK